MLGRCRILNKVRRSIPRPRSGAAHRTQDQYHYGNSQERKITTHENLIVEIRNHGRGQYTRRQQKLHNDPTASKQDYPG